MDTQDPGDCINAKLGIFKSYQSVAYLSIKHNSYFQVYDELFRSYVGKTFTFVEVGVLNGGSLFMWRNYFGPNAKIIGIDLNPAAERWRADGFDIVIGDQSDAAFWDDFFLKYGPVDVLLDDGGHTNVQQVMTAHKAIQNVRSGGLVVVEDVHTSYWRGFGNPSKYSFVSFSKRIVDAVNSRFPSVRAVKNSYGRRVFSVLFYESIVAFKIDEERSFVCRPVSNGGRSVNADDFRYDGSLMWHVERVHAHVQKNTARFFAGVPIVKSILLRVFHIAHQGLSFMYNRARSRSLKDLFE